MTRSHEEEITYRVQLRQRYFEDPNYRRWSDIVPLDSASYGNWWDDILFCYCIFGHTTSSSYALEKITVQLDKGLELPINWTAFYRYFDTILADTESNYNHDLRSPRFIGDIVGDKFETMSVKDLLDTYRNQLTNVPYDIV